MLTVVGIRIGKRLTGQPFCFIGAYEFILIVPFPRTKVGVVLFNDLLEVLLTRKTDIKHLIGFILTIFPVSLSNSPSIKIPWTDAFAESAIASFRW